jgi:hypothetical protein
MEQQDKHGDLIKDGDLVVEGKTYAASTLEQIRSTLDLSDGELFPLGGMSGDVNTSFDIRINSLGNGTVRLAVSAKQSRSESLEAGASRSWNLSLEATKIVKLGKKVKLEFGDEKTIGTKCTFEGVIEEKAPEKK